jgi:hypothetical protein
MSTQSINIKISEEAHHALRIYCAAKGVQIGETVSDIILDWLRMQPPLQLPKLLQTSTTDCKTDDPESPNDEEPQAE